MAKTTALLLLVLLCLFGLAAPAAADEPPPDLETAAAQLRAAHRAAAVAAVTGRDVVAPAPTQTAERAADVVADPPAPAPAPDPVRTATATAAPPSTPSKPPKVPPAPTPPTTVVLRDDATGGILIRGTSAEVLGPAVTIDAERPTEVLGDVRSQPAGVPGQPALVDGAELAVTGRTTDDLTALALGLLAIGTVCIRASRPKGPRSRSARTTGRPRWGGPLRVRAQGTW